MKHENKALLKKYIICFCIASLITVIVFAIEGFFTQRLSKNLIILGDGFSISGVLFLLFAGMMFISGEGALIGLGFILRSVVQAFVPMGRKNHESYAKYRERKLKNAKKSSDHCILITGLVFLFVGIIFMVIWSSNFYNVTA